MRVDDFIELLIPHLDPGDIIIDGGNSHFPDTERRVEYVESKGLLYVGTGVSGGEEGALLGPSIMPGGSKAAWPAIQPRSEEHTSELQSLMSISYVVFCLKKKNITQTEFILVIERYE